MELLIRKIVLRDVEIKLTEARIEGSIIPDIVCEILKDLEDNYKKQSNA